MKHSLSTYIPLPLPYIITPLLLLFITTTSILPSFPHLTECPPGYWGDNCTSHCNDTNCYTCNETNGECITCNTTYILFPNLTCIECPSTCLNNECTSNYTCITCASPSTYGDLCDLSCPINCSPSNTSTSNCDRYNGTCYSCKAGYYDTTCERACPSKCKSSCDIDNGCDECEDGYYGKWCNSTCPEHCLGNKCDKNNGSCYACEEGYFDNTCERKCEGCLNGCGMHSGMCNDFKCKDGYYNVKYCNSTCSDKCVNGLCNAYNGECLACPVDDNGNKQWGVNCALTCSTKCDDDNRVDCCYAWSDDASNKTKTITLALNRFEPSTSHYLYMNITIGSMNITLTTLVDFDSNSPLVVFENRTNLCNNNNNNNNKHKRRIAAEEEEDDDDDDDNIINCDLQILPKYNSSESSSFTSTNFNRNYNGRVDLFDYNGTYANDIISFSTIDNTLITMNVNFIIPISIHEKKGFDITTPFNAVVGFGYLNAFSIDLYTNNLINKNIMLLPSLLLPTTTTLTVTFGAYPSHMLKENFTKLTTMNAYIHHDDMTVRTNLTGITYLIRKGVRLGKDVVLSKHRASDICFDLKWKNFFEVVFPGNISKDCYADETEEKVLTIYCKKEQVPRDNTIHFVFGNYTYMPSLFGFLFPENVNGFLKYVVKLCDEKLSVFGKEFFEDFVFLFNNENNTINVYSDNRTKRLDVKLGNFSDDWGLTKNDVVLTPGFFAVLGIGLLTVVVCYVYISKCCYHRDNINDDMIEKEGLMNI